MNYQKILLLTIQILNIVLGEPWISPTKIGILKASRRIKYGKYVKQVIPYQVAIFFESKKCSKDEKCNRDKDVKRCSGALISPKMIITAAHCIKGYTNFQILYGTTDAMDQKMKPKQTTKVKIARYHPDFNRTSLLNDIGVLGTKDDIVSENVKTIDLIDFDPPEGTQLIISGWGGTQEFIRSRYLKMATVSVTNHDKCVKSYVRGIITTDTLCITGVDGYNCQGDSGGPVTFLSSKGPKLVGVMSGGNAECNPNIPSTVTKIRPYLDWIKSITPSIES